MSKLDITPKEARLLVRYLDRHHKLFELSYKLTHRLPRENEDWQAYLKLANQANKDDPTKDDRLMFDFKRRLQLIAKEKRSIHASDVEDNQILP